MQPRFEGSKWKDQKWNCILSPITIRRKNFFYGLLSKKPGQLCSQYIIKGSNSAYSSWRGWLLPPMMTPLLCVAVDRSKVFKFGILTTKLNPCGLNGVCKNPEFKRSVTFLTDLFLKARSLPFCVFFLFTVVCPPVTRKGLRLFCFGFFVLHVCFSFTWICF